MSAQAKSAAKIAAELEELDQRVGRVADKVQLRGSLGTGQLQDLARRMCWSPEALAKVLARAVEVGRVERYKNFAGHTRYRVPHEKDAP